MSVMDRAPTRLCDLPPEELRRHALAHVDGFFGEVRAAGEHIRTEWSPVRLVRKHPLATAAVIGVAGFAVARLFRGRRRTPRGAAEPMRAAEPIGRTVGRTLLSGLAGSAAALLPELLRAHLRRRGG
jgi:hypothetical protein